jgi:hypothetical protein
MDEFNPKPASQKYLSHSLVDLLNQVSTGFKRNFAILLKRRHVFSSLISSSIVMFLYLLEQ